MENGGYVAEGVIWNQHSNRLLIEILKHFTRETRVLDIGCGHNWYVSVLDYMGYNAIGCDLVDLKSKMFFPHDVTQPIREVEGKFNVLSFEVGEHIPLHLSIGYFDNVCRFGGDVIMSWAVPGQAGVGHVNCQPMEYVIERMALRGYKLDFNKTHELRNAVKNCHCNWFKNTLMFFTPSNK